MDGGFSKQSEQTLLLIKPDGVARDLTQVILERIDREGLLVEAVRLGQLSRERAESLYEEFADQDYFPDLIEFITSGPSMAVRVSGQDAIKRTRLLITLDNPRRTPVGTIRGDYATSLLHNVVHASDSPEAAEREIKLFFQVSEPANLSD